MCAPVGRYVATQSAAAVTNVRIRKPMGCLVLRDRAVDAHVVVRSPECPQTERDNEGGARQEGDVLETRVEDRPRADRVIAQDLDGPGRREEHREPLRRER